MQAANDSSIESFLDKVATEQVAHELARGCSLRLMLSGPCTSTDHLCRQLDTLSIYRTGPGGPLSPIGRIMQVKIDAGPAPAAALPSSSMKTSAARIPKKRKRSSKAAAPPVDTLSPAKKKADKAEVKAKEHRRTARRATRKAKKAKKAAAKEK